MNATDRQKICRFVKAAVRRHNLAMYRNFKYFGKTKRAYKREHDISLYPPKVVYEYYTDVIEDSNRDLLVLRKKDRAKICDYIENHSGPVRPYLEKAIEETEQFGYIFINGGWESEPWAVAPHVMDTILEAFWLLNRKRPKFTRAREKNAFLNSINDVKELAYYDHALLRRLEVLEKELQDEPYLTDGKIYQSVYLKLILALSNRLYVNNGAPALSPTYEARIEADTIMEMVFNQKKGTPTPPKSFDDIEIVNYRGFLLYKLKSS
jgi:hypothetical protein